MPKPLHESTTLVEATTTADQESGVLEVEFITAGWGSSGYYSREVVEAAAPLFPVGTHLYFDHPSATEDSDRPERSVRDLAAVVTEAGAFNTASGGVRGKVKPLKPYRDLLTDEAFTKNVGLSIRGSATDIAVGEAEGRTGPIIEGLADISSVDFVTRAGRGGRVLQVLESARGDAFTEETARLQLAEARNVGQWIESRLHLELTRIADDMFGDGRLTREERIQLSSAVGDALTAFVANLEAGAPALYQRDLWADPAQMLAASESRHVPATRSDDTTTSQEDTMPQIEEARLRQLEEASGRVPTLESERDAAAERATTAERERDEARGENARLNAREAAVTHARTRVTEANAALPAATVDRIVAQATATVTLTEAGQLDTAALDTAVDTARTAEETYLAGLAEAAGIGSITGFGGTPAGDQTPITEAAIDDAVGGAFGRQVKEA